MDNPFLRIYDAHLERIYRYHFARTRHRETAEDLTGHTFLKAYEHFSGFDASKASATTWLYRIARNTLIDHLRRLRPSQPVDELAELLPSGEDTANGVLAREAVEQAHALLARLTPEQRAELGIGDGLIRFSAGLEHPDDVIGDLTTALDAV